MESQDNNSISIISIKDNYYKFDNYGNVMADSIEDLLYDKYNPKYKYKGNYNIKNKLFHSEKSNFISLSSSVLEDKKNEKGKEKQKNEKKDIKIEITKDKIKKVDNNQLINNIYNPENNNNQAMKNNMIIKSKNSSKDILSGTDDKFLESNIPEDNIEKIENILNNDNSISEDKFMKSLEGNYIDPIMNENKKIKNSINNNNNDKQKNNEDLFQNLIIINSNNANDNNIKKLKSNNNSNISDNNESNSKKNNKDYKNIIHNRNGGEITESTKVNSKKSNTLNYFNPDLKSLKKYKTIKKIQINNTSNTVNKKLNNKKDETKFTSNKMSVKIKKNIIKLSLNDKVSKSPIPKICYITKLRKNFLCNEKIQKKQNLSQTNTDNSILNYNKGPLLSVVNGYYFCTKEIGIDRDNNENNPKSNNKYNDNDNNNDAMYKDSDIDYDYDEQFNKEKLRKKNKNKSKSKSKIKKNFKNKINENKKNKDPEMFTELELDKYHNPQNIRIKINNPFYPLFKLVGQGDKTIHLNSLNKVKNRYLNKNTLIKNDSDKNNIKINNRRKLGPLKIKRISKANSTNSLYTTKYDNISGRSDYINNYNFNNKEIRHAIGYTDGRVCQACISLNKKRLDKNKLNMKSFETGLKKANNYLKDERNLIRSNNNNFYSYNKNSKKMSINRQKNYNVSNSSISSGYAKVINIDFPVLNSYFH